MKLIVVALALAVLGSAIGLGWMLLTASDQPAKPVAPVQAAPHTASPTSRDASPTSRAVPIVHRVERAESAPVEGFRVIGRVVRPSDREPVARANIRFELTDGAMVLTSNQRADERGSFEFQPPRESFTVARLKAMTPTGHGKRTIELEPPFVGTRDLGEVELTPFHTIWFRVLTSEGTAIAGARAHPVPGGTLVAKADAGGNGSIESDVPMTAIRFTAPGFEIIEVPVPLGEDSLTVRLPRGTSLTIRVTTPAGDPAIDATTVSIESEESLYALPKTDPLWTALDNTPPSAGIGGSLTFQANPVRLCPVKPNLKMTITVRERAREELVKREVTLAPGESRVLDIVLPGEFGRLRGRVLTTRGDAIQSAAVTFGKLPLVRTTNADGEYDFGVVPSQPLDLTVSSVGYAFWCIGELRVQKGAAPLDVRLDEGIRLEVRLLDADGTPVKGARVYALDRNAMTLADGTATLMHLPRDRVPIDVYVSGVRTAFEHDTSDPAATLRLDYAVKK